MCPSFLGLLLQDTNEAEKLVVCCIFCSHKRALSPGYLRQSLCCLRELTQNLWWYIARASPSLRPPGSWPLTVGEPGLRAYMPLVTQTPPTTTTSHLRDLCVASHWTWESSTETGNGFSCCDMRQEKKESISLPTYYVYLQFLSVCVSICLGYLFSVCFKIIVYMWQSLTDYSKSACVELGISYIRAQRKDRYWGNEDIQKKEWEKER